MFALRTEDAESLVPCRGVSFPEQTTVVLVSRADRAALREAARAAGELSGLGVANQRLVINGRSVVHISACEATALPPPSIGTPVQDFMQGLAK